MRKRWAPPGAEVWVRTGQSDQPYTEKDDWKNSWNPNVIPPEGDPPRTEVQMHAAIDPLFRYPSNWQASASAPDGVEFRMTAEGGNAVSLAALNASIAAGNSDLTVFGSVTNGAAVSGPLASNFAGPNAAHRAATVATTVVPSIREVEFIQCSGNEYGDLVGRKEGGEVIDGNPARFMGGFQFFPDAEKWASRTIGRNVVRVRVSVAGATAADLGRLVYFRSFDVDDPSSDPDIDGDGITTNPAGDDNRGLISRPTVAVDGKYSCKPTDAAATQHGFTGYLRPIDTNGSRGQWVGPALGRTEVYAPLRQDATGFYAEVDLATSYAPGDNFRVAAAITQADISALKNRNLTVNPIPTNGPGWQITRQLSVWRRFHIECDRMASVANATSKQNITASQATADEGCAVIQLAANALQNTAEDQYNGGILRLMAQPPRNYHIISSDPENDTVTVIGEAATIIPPNSPAIACAIYEDSFSTVADRENRVVGKKAMVDTPQNENNHTVVHVTPSDFTMGANDFANGCIMIGNSIPFPVLSNTVNGTLTVDIANNTLPDPDGDGTYTISVFRNLGTTEPTILRNTEDDAHLYDRLQPLTNRDANPFADAYIVPVRDLPHLPKFNSGTLVTAKKEIDRDTGIEPITTPVCGIDSEGARSDVFWCVYVTTGFRGTILSQTGVEDVLGATTGDGQRSIILLDEIRKAFVQGVPLSDAQIRARVTVHEVGHQFGLSTGSGTDEVHRDDYSDAQITRGHFRPPEPGVPPPHNDNIMNKVFYAGPNFFFDPLDVDALRCQRTSPKKGKTRHQ